MSTVRHEIELANTISAETTGEAVRLDYQGSESFERAVQGTLVSGDIIEIETSIDKSIWSNVLSFNSTVFGGSFTGPWKWVRYNKIGTNGAATVIMLG